jgi:hypothetical protein
MGNGERTELDNTCSGEYNLFNFSIYVDSKWNHVIPPKILLQILQKVDAGIKSINIDVNLKVKPLFTVHIHVSILTCITYPFWLIDCLMFYAPLKNISLIWRRHHHREGLQNLGLCSALRALEQGGIFIVPHLLWHGLSIFPVSSKDHPIQSPITTHKGMWRIYSNPDPHGSPPLLWLGPSCLGPHKNEAELLAHYGYTHGVVSKSSGRS